VDFRCQLNGQVAPAIKKAFAVLIATTVVTLPNSSDARGSNKARAAHTSSDHAGNPSHLRQTRQTRQIRQSQPRARSVALAHQSHDVTGALNVGPAAIRAANAEALAPSRADGFINGAQVFPFEAGRVFEVWTAPLRITTISLETGETITNKASGDTERWMIGDTTSGTGATLQTHILVKPYKAGIATNMVVTTNRRVYLLSLRAAESPDAFNAAVTWTHTQPLPSATQQIAGGPTLIAGPLGRTAAIGTLNQNYRIRAGWRKPPWTPLSVSDDGRQTFITFPESLAATEAPPLFVVSDRGESQLVNWRKQGNVYVVDRIFAKAELRLGSTNPRIVHIERKEPRS
jgi:type IV secretion system protein TrbG